MLKSLASLQLPFENATLSNCKENHKKSANAPLQRIDSFEIEGGFVGNTGNTGNPREFHESLEKIPMPQLTLQNIQVPSSKELEDLYDIRKSTMIKVSTLIEEDTEGEKTQEIARNDKENEGKQQFRRGFSYSDFESGGDNKRRVTFEKQYEEIWRGKVDFLGKLRKMLGKCCEFSLIKSRLENSFVDVVITCSVFYGFCGVFIVFYGFSREKPRNRRRVAEEKDHHSPWKLREEVHGHDHGFALSLRAVFHAGLHRFL